MPTYASNIEVGAPRKPPEWDATTAARAKHFAAAQGVTVGVLPASKPQFDPPRGLTQLAPGTDRGALFMADPNNPSEGDALFFTYYPTQLQEQLGALLAVEDKPGRAMPVIQRLGGKGARFNLDLLFYDAFLPDPNITLLDRFAWGSKVGSKMDVSASFAKDVANPRRPPALVARTFLEVYTVGHDGSGAALPDVDCYLLWGGTDKAIRVVIEQVDMLMEHFDPWGNPQSLQARVGLIVYEPSYLVHPFKPREKPPGKPGSKKLRCPIGLPAHYAILNIQGDPLVRSAPLAAQTVAEAALAEAARRKVEYEQSKGIPSGFPSPDKFQR